MIFDEQFEYCKKCYLFGSTDKSRNKICIECSMDWQGKGWTKYKDTEPINYKKRED